MKAHSILLLVVLQICATLSLKSYSKDERIALTVSNLSPGGNPEHGKFSLYPINYHDETSNFCYNDKYDENNPKQSKYHGYLLLNLYHFDRLFSDDVFFGPVTLDSIFQRDVTCQQLCWRDYGKVNASRINFLIENDYRINFMFDDLPVGKEFFDVNTNKFYTSSNIPIGYKDINHVLHIYIHWQFIVYYESSALENYNIIKVIMQQRSSRRQKQHENQCQIFPPQTLREKDNVNNKVIFTYDLIWKEVAPDSTNHYDAAHRYEQYHHYLVNPNLDLAHYLVIVVLIAFVATQFKYKMSTIHLLKVDLEDNFGDDWSSLKNDIGRLPKRLLLLSNLTGLGCQFSVVTIVVLILLMTNTINSVVPNEIKRVFLKLTLISSPIHSVMSTKVYKYFAQPDAGVRKLIFTNAVFTVTILLAINLFLNAAYKSVNSTKYIPLRTMGKLFFVFYLPCYVPLSIIGSIFALRYKILPISSAKVSLIEKKIPTQPFLSKAIVCNLVAASFPFAVLSNKFVYLWTSILFNNLYFGFGSYFISIVLAVVLLLLINILMVFNSLNLGNWKWQWLSFLNGAFVGVFSFLYGYKFCGWVAFNDIQSFVIFTCQNLIISTLIGTCFGAVNFLTTWRFISLLYNI